MLDNVQRMRTPAAEVFWRDHVAAHTPVIITDLMDGQPIGRIRTQGAAVESFPDLPLEMQDDYATAFLSGAGFGQGRRTPTTLRRFCDYLASDAERHEAVVELPTPPALARLYDVPALCRRPLGNQFTFMAGAGNYTQLHFDWAPTHNLLYQVFGEKEVILIPADQAGKLNPIFNVGTALLARFSEREKDDFVRFAGGWRTRLRPGETLFMPMFIWHHLEYPEPALSLAIRFGEDAAVRRVMDLLGGDVSPHRDMFAQNLLASVSASGVASAGAERAADRLAAAAADAPPDPIARYGRMAAAVRTAYEEISGGEALDRYNFFPVEAFRDDMLRRMAKAFLEGAEMRRPDEEF